MIYTTPGGSYSRLYADMAQQKHLLIAGATGSGKSTALDGILNAILHGSPADDRLILIDLKKVELIDYHHLPHLHSYADDVPSALQALQTAIDIMIARYTDMQRRRIKEYDGSHLYVIIDELADLMTTAPKQAAPLIQRITQLGRGAACHMIAATQCPISAVIPTPIKVNFPAKLGLMTATAQDSRNIGPKLDLYQLPRIPDAERHRIIDHWTRQSA